MVATVRALARGWQPLGDIGLMLVRSATWARRTTRCWGCGRRHRCCSTRTSTPGPLYPDVLVLPVRLLGAVVGLAVGVMLVNMAAATLAVVVARRVGGGRALVAVAAAVVGLQWAMGSEAVRRVATARSCCR